MARKIDTEAVINWERLAQQSSNPASPAAGYWYLFIKSDGLYIKDSGGNVMGPIRGMANSTLWDAAGDLAQGTGADTGARLAIGTANQLLRVNSGATAVEWAGVGRVLIAQNTPTGNSTSFTSIPATYTHLVIEYVCRSDKAAVTSENMKVFLNNDTTAANYRRGRAYGYGTNTVAADGGDDSNYDDPPAANAPAGSCSRGICNILFYAGTTFNKQVWGDAASRRDATTVHEFRIATGVEWENTAAVNRVDFTLASGNFVAGSTFRLYGVY